MNKRATEVRKPYEELEFRDNFMFGRVMQDKELGREDRDLTINDGAVRSIYQLPRWKVICAVENETFYSHTI